jgi:glycosyltransferase involved in cell wall biosynthesis
MDSQLRSLYICYLSLDDPLVHTQVVAYLEGLAGRGHVIHLVTFDPPLAPARRQELAAAMAEKGITWHSARYHKRPSLPATIFDTFHGAALAVRLIRRHRLNAIHARNHVPAAMALLVRRITGARMIFDIRGLMAEEYVDAGRWKRDGVPYRITTGVQSAAIKRADGVVMLTHAVRRHLLGTPPSRDSARVIPCCADLDRIDRQLPERARVRDELDLKDRTVMVYVGKFTGRYMEREMVEFFAVARKSRPDLAFLVLTQSEPEAITAEFERFDIEPSAYRVTRANPEHVGRYLAAADFGICFYQPKFCEIAASPTKVGEYLGAGLPVVASAGIGDLDELVTGNSTGVLVGRFDPAAYEASADAIWTALADPGTAERCRSLARTEFSLALVGVTRYDDMYRHVAESPA